MSCATLIPQCLFIGASFFDFGIRVFGVDGLPVDITGYDFDYTWTRLGDGVVAIALDESDSEVTVGAGVDSNQVTIALTGADTTLTKGTYCAKYVVDDGAGNTWIATRIITLKEAGCCP